VEIESQWTARIREQAGMFPTVCVRPPQENPRPSRAWTGPLTFSLQTTSVHHHRPRTATGETM